MKTIAFTSYSLWSIVMLALLFQINIGCNNVSVKKETDHTAAELILASDELDSLFLVAFNKGDAEAIMDLHWNSPELVTYPPGESQVNGYDAVKATYTREFAASKGAKLEYINTNNIPFADGVVGHGAFRWSMPMEGDDPMVFEGRYTEVKAFKDGRMVIIHDHTSMPLPPPPVDSTQTK